MARAYVEKNAVITAGTAGGANLREGAGTTYATLATLTSGTEIVITNEATDIDNDVWYLVRSGALTGYIRSDLVTVLKTLGVVTASTLNVRTGPSTSYSSVTSLAQSSIVTVLSTDTSTGSTWYYICTDGGAEGYVSGSYLRAANLTYDAAFENYLISQGFPESYKPKLRVLHAAYPKWVFCAQDTGLDWTASVTAESELGKSLVPGSSISSWKSTQDGAYNWDTGTWTALDSGNWVQASEAIISYYMDPRNCLSGSAVFQFLSHEFNASAQTVAGIEQMVNGTFLANTVTDTDSTPLYYPQAIYNIGQAVNVNPYVLASMIIQEIGRAGASGSISGTNTLFPGYFNYFNVGAYATATYTAIERGLWYASGSGAGATTYNRPWDTRYKSMLGGAMYYAGSYTQKGQNTLYLKKFNVQGSSPYTHQYMTNVIGATSEGNIMASAYSESLRDSALIFYIPVYDNMPDKACVKPTADGSPNSRLASLTVDGCVLTPEFNYDTLEYSVIVPYEIQSANITAAGVVSGATVTGTGTKSLNVGINTATVTVVSEDGLNTRTYTITIARQQDPSLVTVTTNYRISGDNLISGITTSTTVSSLISKISLTGGATIKVKNSAGVEKSGANVVGTGDIVTVYNPDNSIFKQYTVLIKGDISGDGSISMSDLIKIRNHILGTSTFSGIYFNAGDISGDGKISMTDLIKVRNHILGTALIVQ